MDEIKQIKTGGVTYPIKDETARQETKALFEQSDALYEGVDLTKVFALEIAKFSDAWAWIKDRITKANYTGIHVGDYIPMVFKGETHKMQVAGIDTYYRTTDQELGHHIDFISKDCYSATVKWNTTNNNNGSESKTNPYMASNLKKFLDGLVSDLPAEVQKVISGKRMLMEVRYSGSGPLTDSTGWAWKLLGNLWVPTEYEVFDSVVWGTKGWSAGQAIQYPIFANSYKNRIKGAGPGGARCTWWVASAGGGESTHACYVGHDGHANCYNASGDSRVPLCFRVAA